MYRDGCKVLLMILRLFTDIKGQFISESSSIIRKWMLDQMGMVVYSCIWRK